MTPRSSIYVLTIVIGLWASATSAGGLLPDHLAEWPVNAWCWGLFCWIFATTNKKERIEMITVIAIATPLELFFSEVWLIYEYQRGLMPLFVPVGHYFLFDLGRNVARSIKTPWLLPLLAPFVPLTLYGAWTGGDTIGLFLLALTLGFALRGPQPKLYVAMAWLALAMELWGTALGNWAWATNVPWTGLTAWNPPLLVGAFYCFGDLIVNLCVAKFQGHQPAEVPT